ncbi:MAG: M23 family metallopeptidase [Streptosporangiaceae bacterium]
MDADPFEAHAPDRPDDQLNAVSGRRVRGLHRMPAPSPAARGRVVVAAVAMGALAAAGAGLASQDAHATAKGGAGDGGSDGGPDARAAMGMGGTAPASPEVLLMAKASNPSAEVSKLTESKKAIAQREAAEAEARRPKFVVPAQGRLSSGFGGRWGAFHYGIDIANAAYTPIVAAADGVIIDAGPAQGFGLWVREKLSDGTILVYGHMHDYSVHIGDHVQAGDQIARMGERGESTGYHLHFGVWNPSGKKINPLPWLHEHGVSL